MMIAGGLLALALVLFVVSLAIDALRWLLIIAAIVLIVGAVVGWKAKDGDEPARSDRRRSSDVGRDPGPLVRSGGVGIDPGHTQRLGDVARLAPSPVGGKSQAARPSASASATRRGPRPVPVRRRGTAARHPRRDRRARNDGPRPR
jgi:hypothetical protein